MFQVISVNSSLFLEVENSVFHIYHTTFECTFTLYCHAPRRKYALRNALLGNLIIVQTS